MRVLLDTCILIDALKDRRPFSSEARALLDASALKYYEAYASVKELTDIYYIMRNYHHNEAQARNSVSHLVSILNILDSTSSQLQVALHSNMPDFEDAVMAQVAAQNNLDLIVTRNLKDYKNSPVLAVSPADCLKKLGIKS